jgi:hypothetical protein
MPGFGPRKGSEAASEPAMVDRDAAAAVARQFYADGQAAVTGGGYQAGHDLAWDVGYGARNDHVRPFVAGVLEGHAAGLEARRELIEAARAGQAAAESRAAHGRIEARQAAAQPELEAEAG